MRVINTLLALMLLALPACASSTPIEPEAGPAAQQELVTRETEKWDLVFGSPADRTRVLTMYADDFVSVGYGATGAERTGIAQMKQGISFFPELPRGSFTVSEMQVIRPGDESIVLSYRITGPGPNGPGWQAYASSTWAFRGGEWRTVYYQATEVK